MENPARRGRPPGIRTAEGQLTDRQAAIVRCITEAVLRQGYPPSMREIGQAVELASTSSVAYQLTALERMGVVYRDPHTARAYRVRPSWAPDLGGRGVAPVDVPLIGRIAAGAPLLAAEMVEDVYSLPRQFCVKSERVVGEASGAAQAPLVGRMQRDCPLTPHEGAPSPAALSRTAPARRLNLGRRGHVRQRRCPGCGDRMRPKAGGPGGVLLGGVSLQAVAPAAVAAAAYGRAGAG
jgi:hypothetical protein